MGSEMPLLTLCEPAFVARVGVSKPAGASVGSCGALSAMSGTCKPIKKRTEGILRLMRVSLKCEFSNALHTLDPSVVVLYSWGPDESLMTTGNACDTARTSLDEFGQGVSSSDLCSEAVGGTVAGL